MTPPRLVNATGHVVKIKTQRGSVYLKPELSVRVIEWRTEPVPIDYNNPGCTGSPIPTRELHFGGVHSLPPEDKEAQIVYIVAWPVALQLLLDGDPREDIVCLDEKVNDGGRTVASRALVYIKKTVS